MNGRTNTLSNAPKPLLDAPKLSHALQNSPKLSNSHPNAPNSPMRSKTLTNAPKLFQTLQEFSKPSKTISNARKPLGLKTLGSKKTLKNQRKNIIDLSIEFIEFFYVKHKNTFHIENDRNNAKKITLGAPKG